MLKRWCVVLLVVLSGAANADEKLAADLNEQVVRLPVRVTLMDGHDVTREMIVTTYHASTPGQWPLIVINHGRWGSWDGRARVSRFRFDGVARYFISKGYAVVVPTRVGYGDTGGNLDPEDMDCARHVIVPTLQSAGNEILAAVRYASRQSWADPSQIVLLGQSWGGIASVTAAAANPKGVVATINFAGGIGGHLQNGGVPCAGDDTTKVFALLGKVSRVPNLWIYSENDKLFGPEYTKAWAAAYAKSGGPLEFHLLPPFEDNGHYVFDRGWQLWVPIVDKFLDGKVSPPVVARHVKGR